MFCSHDFWAGGDIVNRFIGYVLQSVAGVCEIRWYDDDDDDRFEYEGRHWLRHDTTTPLPDELPAEITPELAERLLPELLIALERNTELLLLLHRRAAEEA